MIKSSLEKVKSNIFKLYEEGYGAPEIKKELGLDITERSIQRFLKKHGKIRSREEAFLLSNKRRIKTIKTKWKDYEKTSRTTVGPKKRYRIMKRDGFACQLCGAKSSDGAILEVDHVKSIHLNGDDRSEDNLQTLCFRCNKGKYQSENPIFNPNPKK